MDFTNSFIRYFDDTENIGPKLQFRAASIGLDDNVGQWVHQLSDSVFVDHYQRVLDIEPMGNEDGAVTRPIMPAFFRIADYDTGAPNSPTLLVGIGLPGAGGIQIAGTSTNPFSTQLITVPADPFGTNADTIVAAGAAGTMSAKLRRVTQGLEDLKTGIVLAAGANAIGSVTFGGSIPAGVNAIGSVTVTSLPADPLGANADAIVAAGAAGSLSAKLRRLTQGVEDLKTTISLASAVAVSSVPTDPFGTNADAIIAAGAAGSQSAKLRRISQGLEDLKTLIVLAAGTNVIGGVTVPADPFGLNVDAIVAAGAAGSYSAKLRRISQGVEDLKTGIVLAFGTNAIGTVDVSDKYARQLGRIIGKAPDGSAVTNDPIQIAGRAYGGMGSSEYTDGNIAYPWYDPSGAHITKRRPFPTYTAVYRLAKATAGQLSLTKTFAANTEVQLATIYHLSTAAKNTRLRRASLWVSTGAAGVFGFELRKLSSTTTPATGNPAITPLSNDPADAAAEATCLALPTTAGSETNADSPLSFHAEWNSAAAAAQANPSGLAGQEIVLYDYRMADERKPPRMRKATQEGYAVIGRCTTAVALRFIVIFDFTEDALANS